MKENGVNMFWSDGIDVGEKNKVTDFAFQLSHKQYNDYMVEFRIVDKVVIEIQADAKKSVNKYDNSYYRHYPRSNRIKHNHGCRIRDRISRFCHKIQSIISANEIILGQDAVTKLIDHLLDMRALSYAECQGISSWENGCCVTSCGNIYSNNRE